MKKMILLISGITLLAISCSSPIYIPPKNYKVQKMDVLDLSYDDTWYKLLKYLYIEQNIPAKIDKANGLII